MMLIRKVPECALSEGGLQVTAQFFDVIVIPLSLEGIRIQNAVRFISIESHRATVVEQRIDESRLAVVDMSDDGNVSKWDRRSSWLNQA